MCEVNVHNFNGLYPEIKEKLQNSKFISLDLEFSALYPVTDHSPSLFDTPAERYFKLKRNLEKVIPLQVGLTIFSLDTSSNTYYGKVYTFYIQPACFQYVNKTFYFQSSTINFLKLYNFDFNKFAYDGIPFINTKQEQELRTKINSDELSEVSISCKQELEEIISREVEIIKGWYAKAHVGDFLSIPKVCTERNNNVETVYFLHKHLRDRFENIWTYVDNREFTVKKVTEAEFKKLITRQNLEDNIINELLGFTKIFRLITSLKKPLIGHNLLQDLLLMINSFETDLPESYTDFKKLISELFPVVFDTRTISYEVMRSIPAEKRGSDKGLHSHFEYFKNGLGRHLAPNSPAIELQHETDNYGKFHDAGWDSFCTGYIFIRLAHLNIYHKYPASKQFVSSEYIGGLQAFENKINIIRCSVSSINLDGPDPNSTRPPYLVIESLKNKLVSIPQITTLLNDFGYIEVQKFPHLRHRALIAVDNYGNAKRILRDFRNNTEFHVGQYSVLKHSPVVRAFLMGGITVSGALILWLTHSVIRR